MSEEKIQETKSEKDLEEKEEQIQEEQIAEVEENTSSQGAITISSSELKTGMYIKVYQRISELDSKGKEKTRTQAFEGLVIRRKHGNEVGATFTVRKEYKTGHVVEKIYPINLPSIEKIELIKKLSRVKKSKILFVRNNNKKKLKYQSV